MEMYMHAMELVRMGDTSVEAYEHLISLFKNCAAEMKPFAEIRDALGLQDRLAEWRCCEPGSATNCSRCCTRQSG